MPFQREDLAKRISNRLNVLANQLKTQSRASFTDANHTLEFVMARLFNALFDWQLVNLNAAQTNFPAADLGDRERRIALQITNEDSSQKIKETARKVVEHQLGKDYDRFIIFFLLPRKPGMPQRFVQPVNGPEIKCWDLADLLKTMQNLEGVTALVKAATVLDEELGEAESHNVRISLHQLPPRPEGFVGRNTDLEKLRGVSPATGAVLTGLKGMGGIGKTALGLVLAHEWLPRFPDAQLFLDARGTQENPPSAWDLLAQVIQTFQPTAKIPDDETQLRGLYHDLLHDKKVLIMVDNVASAAQAAPLIPPAGSALIVTSRHSFMLDKTAPHHVGRLPDADAAALLREYHPVLSDDDAAELVKICAGLPLALRLAGAHLALDASDGQADTATYLKALRSGRLAYLDAEAPNAGEVTISETLRLSEAKLPPAEREAWRKLGIFTASFDAAAAQAIAGVDDPMLASFVRRSLLEREGADRFRVHDLAAEYARAQYSGAEITALHVTHARYYCEVSRQASALYEHKGKTLDGLALFDRERAQIEAAFAWLTTQRNPAAAVVLLDLVNTVVHTSNLRFHAHQRIAWLEAQLDSGRITGHRKIEGDALGNLGNAYADLGNARKAIEFYQQALSIAREIGDRRGEGNGLMNLGSANSTLGNTGQVIEFYEQALVIAREIGDRLGESNALGNLGTAYVTLGDTRKAIALHEQALVIAREIGDRHGESVALGNLGTDYNAVGDARKAIGFHEQTLVIAREIGDRRVEGKALGNLGTAHAALGDARKAIEFHEQHLVIAREIGDRRGEGKALGKLGSAHAALGDARNSIEFHEQHLGIAREIGVRRGESIALGDLGTAYAALGDARKAIEFYEQRLVIVREIGARRGESVALGNLGTAHRELGNVQKAIECHEQQRAIAVEIGDRRGEGAALGGLGNAYAVLGETRKVIEFNSRKLVISRETGDRRAESGALVNLGNSHAALGDARKAIDFLEQALPVFREIEDRRGEGATLGGLGNAYKNLGEVRKAIDFYEQALPVFRKIGDRRGEGRVLGGLGNAHTNLGDVQTALEFYHQALVVMCEIGDRHGQASLMGALGNAHIALGDALTAIRFFDKTLAVMREIGDRSGEANSLFNSAIQLAKLGQRANALVRAEQAEKIYASIESPHAERVRQLVTKLRG